MFRKAFEVCPQVSQAGHTHGMHVGSQNLMVLDLSEYP